VPVKSILITIRYKNARKSGEWPAFGFFFSESGTRMWSFSLLLHLHIWGLVKVTPRTLERIISEGISLDSLFSFYDVINVIYCAVSVRRVAYPLSCEIFTDSLFLNIFYWFLSLYIKDMFRYYYLVKLCT
jgi:hypothetical protein